MNRWIKRVQKNQFQTEMMNRFRFLWNVLVFDLNEFEYPTSTPSLQNVKYLYRFRLDDGTGDQNPTFEQFSAVYETYTRLEFVFCRNSRFDS